MYAAAKNIEFAMLALMAIEPYHLALTTGGLYLLESTVFVHTYFAVGNWDMVRKIVVEENLLKTRTRASAVRISREIKQRLQTLTHPQLLFLSEGNREAQRQILWLAVCKKYRLIREFAVEVIREKIFRLDLALTYADFDSFLNAKAEWHAELAGLTNRTRSEMRRVTFQILRDAEILDSDRQILPALPQPRVARAILSDDAALCAIFPVSDSDFHREAAR